MNQINKFLKQLVVVDTETTGIDAKSSEVIEVASGVFIDNEWQVEELLIKPEKPIPAEASAINHISNKMVADSLTFGEQRKEILHLLKVDSAQCMVAHNSNFDRLMLQESYMRCLELDTFMPFDEERRWICTWRLAKAVLGVDYDKFTQYGLSYLRYKLELDVPDDLPAHRAAFDVIVCGRLLEELVAKAIEYNLVDPTEDLLPQIVGICWDPIPVTKWTIGKKYAGFMLADIPTDYYMWALANIDELNEDTSRYNRDLAACVEKILEDRNVL